MTAPTLPTPGGDIGTWGIELNAWLNERDTKLTNMRAGVAYLLDYVTPSDDATANRVGIQQLLDNMAGDQATLIIPPRYDAGTPDPIVLDSNGVDPWCLDVPSGVTIEGAGAGSSLKVADDLPNFHGRIFRVVGKENVTIRNLRLDGNKAGNNPAHDQSHNIIIWESTDVLVEDVETVDATGDGIIIGGNTVVSRRVRLNRVKGTGNIRNPVTVNEASDIWINECELVCTIPGGQAIDSEPDNDFATENLWITNCKLAHEDPTDYAIATGGKTGYPRRNVHVIGCEIIGGIWVIANDGVFFDRCFGTIDHIEAVGYSNNITFRDCNFDIASAARGLALKYSPTYGIPTNWSLLDCNWTALEEDITLLEVWGSDGFTVRGGSYTGGGGTLTVGLDLHATRSMKDIVIDGPLFDTMRYGVLGYRDDSYTITNLRAWARFRDISEHPFQLTPGFDFISNLVLPPSLLENVPSWGGVSVSNNTPYVLSGIPGRGAYWNCYGTPEGAITEIVGAVAVRRDGGSGTTMYVKESGTGNTGWVAV